MKTMQNHARNHSPSTNMTVAFSSGAGLPFHGFPLAPGACRCRGSSLHRHDLHTLKANRSNQRRLLPNRRYQGRKRKPWLSALFCAKIRLIRIIAREVMAISLKSTFQWRQRRTVSSPNFGIALSLAPKALQPCARQARLLDDLQGPR